LKGFSFLILFKVAFATYFGLKIVIPPEIIPLSILENKDREAPKLLFPMLF